ncbi:hypothetical protein MCHI_000982 [Candidatus Magnetoovum chiemensis]|nr:hypothetical protein MCHI_000982 [Candidatus Magnetoovum chiemensis]
MFDVAHDAPFDVDKLTLYTSNHDLARVIKDKAGACTGPLSSVAATKF